MYSQSIKKTKSINSISSIKSYGKGISIYPPPKNQPDLLNCGFKSGFFLKDNSQGLKLLSLVKSLKKSLNEYHLRQGLKEQSSLIDLRFDPQEQERLFNIAKQQKKDLQLPNLFTNLQNCGSPARYKWNCKLCIKEALPDQSLLKSEKVEIHTCRVRYCKKPDCIEHRYAQILERIKHTKFFKGTRKIEGSKRLDSELNPKDWSGIKLNKTLGLHVSMNFEWCSVKNLKETKKRLDRIVNNFFQKLRKGNPCPKGRRIIMRKTYNPFTKKYKSLPHFLNAKGKYEFCFDPIRIRGIKVFDLKYNFKNKTFHPHYHFFIISGGEFLDFNVFQKVRLDMIKFSKKKKKWIFQVHKNNKRKDSLKLAGGVLKYMTKRAIGIYGKSDKYATEELENKKIRDIIKDKNIYFLSDIMDVESYYDNFYGCKVVSYFGDCCGYIYNDSSFIPDKFPSKCRFHGDLQKSDVLFSVEWVDNPPPPPLSTEELLNLHKKPIREFETIPEHERRMEQTRDKFSKYLKEESKTDY